LFQHTPKSFITIANNLGYRSFDKRKISRPHRGSANTDTALKTGCSVQLIGAEQFSSAYLQLRGRNLFARLAEETRGTPGSVLDIAKVRNGSKSVATERRQPARSGR
jgi:hypothetical protein